MQEQEIVIHAAYGSSKDINVYSSLGLKNEQMYIIGKPSRRQSQLSVHWINGYTEHLSNLNTPGGSRPAEGNARLVLGQHVGLQRRRTFKGNQLRTKDFASRTTSYPYGAPLESSQPSSLPGKKINFIFVIATISGQSFTAKTYLKPVVNPTKRVSF